MRQHWWVTVLGCAVALAPGVSAAQATPCDPGMTCTDTPPTVAFSAAASTTTTAAYSFTVSFTDDNRLNATSAQITVTNGTTVTSVPAGITDDPLHNLTRVQKTYSVTLPSGFNTLTARICDYADAGAQCTSRTLQVTYTPPPPPRLHATPQISTAPQPPDYRLVDQAGSHVGYATASYVSLDQPRSLALFYSSASTASRGFVQVDVFDNSQSVPTQMSIRAKAPDGSWWTPEVFYQGANGTSRLATSWDMSSVQTGTYDGTVVVRSYFSDGSFTEASAPVRVPVITRDYAGWAGLAPGWAIASQQRVRTPAAFVMWVTNGDGTIERFDQDANGIYHGISADLSTMRYDGAGNIVRTYPDGSTVLFSATSGEMTKQVDSFGNATTWNYDAAWRLTSVVDPAGKAITLGYLNNGTGQLATITDPAGRITRLYYNTASDLVSIVDPAGGIAFQGDYQDAYHRMTNTWDRAGQMTSFAYGGNSFLCCVWAPTVTVNGTSTRPYSYAFSPVDGALPASGKGTQSVPADHKLPADVNGYATDPAGYTSYVWVDRLGQPTKLVDPANRATTVTRDEASGLPKLVKGTDGSVELEWNYATGTLAQQTTISKANAVSTTKYAYDTSACPTQPTSVSSDYTTTYFDLGTHCEVTRSRKDAAGLNAVLYTYDSRFRITVARDTAAHVLTRYFRDGNAALNTDSVSVSSRQNPLQTTRFTYDAYGRGISTTDPVGQVSSVTYDLINRPLTSTDPAMRVTRTFWGPVFVDSLIDAAGKRYAWTRNALGWVTSEIEPAGVRGYGYDAKGRVTSATNRRLQTVSFAYDNLDRVTRRISAERDTTRYAYDPDGWWQVVANREARDSVVIDPSWHYASVTTTMGGRQYKLGYVTNTVGRLDSVTVTTPSATYKRGYAYTPAGELGGVGDYLGGTTSIVNDSLQRPVTLTYPGGTVQALAYNSRGLLYTSNYTKGYNNLWPIGRAYGYDELNRVNQRLDAARDTTRYYGYDAAGQLSTYDDWNYWTERVCTGEEANEVCSDQPRSSIYGTHSFSYDAVGNRTDGATLQPNSNRYASFGNTAPAGSYNGTDLSYDADGNLTHKVKYGVFEQWLYWNSLGQLDSVRTGTDVVRYGYNGLGMRVRKSAWNGTTAYLYDQSANLAAEIDGATGGALRLYAYFPGVDQPHSVYSPGTGTRAFYASEEPGHVIGLFNDAGSVVNSYRYTPFGETDGAISESVVNPLRYMSRELDGSTGLYFVRNRWYDPVLGRFVSEDPIGLLGGVNTYAYARNDPANNLDPTGLFAEGSVCYIQIDTYLVTQRSSSGVRQWYEYERTFLGCDLDPASLSREYEETRREAQGNRKRVNHVVTVGPKACAQVPTGPVDVDANIWLASRQQGASVTLRAFWFYDMVRNKGPWDYKQVARQYQDFGNFNFGAAGAALGVSDQILLRGAGWAQSRAGTTTSDWGSYYGLSAPYGDDPADAAQIRAGIDYVRNGCSRPSASSR